MPEHAIQLRKAWVEHREGSVPRRVDLPLESAPSQDLRITRSFGRPPIDPDHEALRLRLDDVPGLRVVRINGQVMIEAVGETDSLEIALPSDLPARNLLELEVEAHAEAAKTAWGRIALVVWS